MEGLGQICQFGARPMTHWQDLLVLEFRAERENSLPRAPAFPERPERFNPAAEYVCPKPGRAGSGEDTQAGSFKVIFLTWQPVALASRPEPLHRPWRSAWRQEFIVFATQGSPQAPPSNFQVRNSGLNLRNELNVRYHICRRLVRLWLLKLLALPPRRRLFQL
jgi:hypothetical protein